MKYITDGKNDIENKTKTDDNLATRTYYNLARRKDRRRCFTQSLIFLSLIFVITSVLGGLAYVYLQRTYGISVAYSASIGMRAFLKDYFMMFIPCALVFVVGFTVFSSLANGLLCAVFGSFTGFIAMELYTSFVPSELLSLFILVVYFLTVLYFSAVSVSFSHRTPPGGDFFDDAFEDDLVLYLRYFALCSSAVLVICIALHAVRYVI